MKCLILGGGGFIGTHLARALLARQYSVRIFDRTAQIPTALRHADIEWQAGDFLNAGDIARALAGCDTVFHLVSTTLPKSANDDPAYDLETNVIGSLRLFDLARTARIRKLIFISSGGTVYGVPQQAPIPESHPTDPITAYGIGKLAIEKYLHLYHTLHGMDYVVLRLSNPFGEYQRTASTQGAVTAFLQRALANQPIEIWGDGSVVRDYLYVGDAVGALVAAIDYQGTQRVINIGSGAGRSLNQIVEAIAALLGNKPACKYLPGRAFDVPVNVLDIRRAAACLGWVPQTSFDEGLRRTADWLKQPPD